MKLFDKVREAWKTAMQSREEILGVEKGFPLDVSVGISPDKRPAKDGEFGDYYLSARYMGNDTWAVAEQYIEPEEMGTVFFEVENHGQMTTQDMMDKFDAEVADFPQQNYSTYNEKPFTAVRDQLKAHAAQNQSQKQPAPTQNAKSISRTA